MKSFSRTITAALASAGLLAGACEATSASSAAGARAQSVPAADPRLALPSTIDRALRTEIEGAATSAALEEVLVRHPGEGQILVPRIEALAVGEVKQDGPGSRFTIEEMTPDDGPARSVTLQAAARTLTVVKEFPTDAFDTQSGSPAASFGDGSVHRYAGRVPFAPELTIVGDGDRNHRLTFAILAGYGMVYLRGTGRIVLSAEGQERTIELGTAKE